MIYCSNLPNDQDMIRALGSLAVPARVPCGDACFYGVGSNGSSDPVRICIERKKIGDMASCILSGRYLYQLQSAHDTGFAVFALVVEGRYGYSSSDGLLVIPGWDSARSRRGWTPVKPTIAFSRFEQYLTELEWLAGVIVKRSENVDGTAAVIRSLWDGFRKPDDGHHSLKTIYKAPPRGGILLTRPSLIRRIASELPGVGWEKSASVEAKFKSVKAMVNASEKEWKQVDGIGKKIARDIVTSINGGKLQILDKGTKSVV